ncbi:hypothetical protein EVAR_20441_1 [Eumeta japonica]|uniref:Spaetzle domain-containing protein n=1 Tax=Eumeta variegata TaxID=151549 RepID=A0A4C1TXY3_EUMVA|nr:hypothetical protein EVAR_20441_1 [Eumeta japonica]
MHVVFASDVDAGDLPIKYPGPIKTEGLVSRYGGSDDRVPELCRGKTYCTIMPDDYPEEKYNEMFKAFKGAPPPPALEEVVIVNRQGDPDDKDDCESIVTYDRLYKVKEVNKDVWRTVVQAPKSDYVQRVRLETCKNTEASCFTNFMSTSQYSTFCKQKFNTWEVVVDDGNGGTEKIKTELPVCCSCHYKPTSIISRLQNSNRK